MPEDMSDRMPEDMPDRMPEDLPDRMPEDRMPEDMLDRMPNRMSEDMSDRMPEDLPVRKCINVMVGITRSKVIFGKFPLCNRFQLGSSFGNTCVFFLFWESSLMYSFSIRQFIWEYIRVFSFLGKFPYVFVFN